jgi:hypothetical protein
MRVENAVATSSGTLTAQLDTDWILVIEFRPYWLAGCPGGTLEQRRRYGKRFTAA